MSIAELPSRWDIALSSLDDYYDSFPKKSDFSAERLIALILAYLKGKEDAESKKCRNFKFSSKAFNEALFQLKMNGAKESKEESDKKFLNEFMSNIHFYYTNGKYFSDEIEIAMTNLQNSEFISFINPDFREFETKEHFNDKSYIENFLGKHNIYEKENIEHLVDVFNHLYDNLNKQG